ncbi:MAG: type II toxin-antitoxin system VapB family antitoxin [Methylococcaceae bacterium]|nr:type II toxin-antitoxin system VapB family antitoxin [Methylococcaceae bacterium]
MQTTIIIDDNLLAEAAKLANTDNQSQLIEKALSEFIQHHKLTHNKARLLELYGAGGIRDDYDYKALRNGEGK